MQLKISGKVYASFNEVIEEIIIDLNKDNFSIVHNDEYAVVKFSNEVKIFENGSLKIL